jgi:hypothetical protein
MLSQNISKMLTITKQLQGYVENDIADTKLANHDVLFSRNKTKILKMDELILVQNKIASEVNDESELNEYKDILDEIENELQALHTLNETLASIVLPVNEIYKEILDDISNSNNGNLIEVNA